MRKELKEEISNILVDFFSLVKQQGIKPMYINKSKVKFENRERTRAYFTTEPEPDFKTTIAFLTTDVFENANTKKLNSLLLEEYPLIQNYFYHTSRELYYKKVLFGIMTSIYKADPEFLRTKELIDSELRRFDELIRSGNARSRSIYTIGNIDIVDLVEPVEIDKDIFLFRLTEQEMNEYYESTLAVPPLTEFESIALAVYCLERIDSPEKRGKEKSNYFQEKEEQMNRFIYALSLSYGGAYFFRCNFHRYIDYYSNFSFGSNRSTLRKFRKGIKNLTLSELEVVIKKYKELKTKDIKLFLFSLSRLIEAEKRNDFIDSILDAVIGLEYLLLNQTNNPEMRGEMRFRFSLNYASLFEKSKRAEKRKLAQDAYDIRSKIVHGGEIKPREKFCNEELNIGQISEKIMQMLRETLNILISQLPGKNFYDGNFWIEQVLGLN